MTIISRVRHNGTVHSLEKGRNWRSSIASKSAITRQCTRCHIVHASFQSPYRQNLLFARLHSTCPCLPFLNFWATITFDILYTELFQPRTPPWLRDGQIRARQNPAAYQGTYSTIFLELFLHPRSLPSAAPGQFRRISTVSLNLRRPNTFANDQGLHGACLARLDPDQGQLRERRCREV